METDELEYNRLKDVIVVKTRDADGRWARVVLVRARGELLTLAWGAGAPDLRLSLS